VDCSIKHIEVNANSINILKTTGIWVFLGSILPSKISLKIKSKSLNISITENTVQLTEYEVIVFMNLLFK